ncbi:hypothetical protein ATANTOWER_012316 [Ataeniobius toweri]|uniref:Uncharacterized protein n=1 Tax=Ataeniobius toweri TaxID=208326 RepID=A0ABU7BB04_9TELE|nr:hypothetical protein [Ataeniobius toweri]
MDGHFKVRFNVQAALVVAPLKLDANGKRKGSAPPPQSGETHLPPGNQFSSLHSVPGFPCSASLLSEFVGELTLRLSVNLLTASLAASLAAPLVHAGRTPQQPLPITHLPVYPAALHGLAPLPGRKNTEVIPTSTSHHAIKSVH